MKRKLFFLAGGLLAFVLILFALLHTSPVEKWVAEYARKYLYEKYNVRVEFGSLSYHLVPPIRIESDTVKVYGGEQNSALFLAAEKLGLVLPYSSLWSDEFVIDEVTLHNFDIDVRNLPQLETEPAAGEGAGGFRIREVSVSGGAVQHSIARLESIDMSASLSRDTLDIKHLQAQVRDMQLRVQGQVKDFSNPAYQATYTLEGDSRSISDIFAQVPPLKGIVRSKGRISGVKDVYKAEGNVQTDGISVNRKPEFSLKADYKVDSSSRPSPYQVDVKWASLPLSLVNDFVKNTPEFNSTASGGVQYTGPADFWSGNGSFVIDIDPSNGKGMPLQGQVSGDLADGAIRVSRGDIALGTTSASLQGVMRRERLSATVNATMRDLKTLSVFVPELKKVPGSYKLQSSIDGPFENLKIAWDLSGSARDMQVESEGTYFTGTRQIEVEAGGFASAALINRFYPAADVSGQLRFDATASGTVNRPVVKARFEGKSLRAKGEEIGESTIDAVSDGQTLTASLSLPSFNATTDATYHIATGTFEVSGQVKDLTLDQLRPVLPAQTGGVEGNITATWNVQGEARNWKRAHAVLRVQEASFQHETFQADVTKAEIEVTQEKASVDLQAELLGGKINVQGTAGLNSRGPLDLRISGNSDLSSLAEFYPDVQASGIMNLDVHIGGSVNKPSYSGVISADSFSAAVPGRGLDAEDARMRVEFSNTIANVDASFRLNGYPVAAQGQVPLTPGGMMNVRARGEGDLKLLSQVTKEFEGNGAVTFDVTAKGTIQAPDLSGAVSAKAFELSYIPRNIRFKNASADATFTGTRVQMRAAGLLNGAQLQLEGDVPLQESDGSLRLQLKSFPIADLVRDADITGAVSIQVDARGRGRNMTAWNGDLRISPENLVVQGTSVQSPAPVHIRLASGIVRLEPLRIDAGEMLTLTAQGNASLQNGEIQGVLQSSAELAFLNAFLSGIQASGKLAADVKISGTLTNPEASGIVRVNDGFIRKPQSPLFLEKVELVAPLERDKITLQTFNAVMGGGKISGNGTVQLAGWNPDAVDIALKAEKVSLRYPMDVRSQVNADLRLTRPEEEFLLSGDVKILRSTLREDIDARTRLVNTLMASRKDLVDPGLSKQALHLDIRVQTEEDFLMNNDLGKVQAAANLEVTGSTDRPQLSGRLHVRHGSVIQFAGNEFDVTRGIIDLYGGPRFDPVFDLELLTIAQDSETGQDYEITLPLSGPLSDLDETEPTSSPPLDPNQIYFLLLTGRADAQISDASSIFIQQQLASYVSGRLFADVQKELANALGLQRVEIQPEMVSSETDPGAKLVLGKDFSDLSLIYSVSLTDSEEQTWVARYRPTRSLSVRFVDQDDGTYTSNIRHVLRFGPGVSNKSLRKPHRPTMERIAAVQIENSSVLNEAEIKSLLSVESGEVYDFWDAYDALDRIEEELQKRGYLFPDAQLETTHVRERAVKLKVRVAGGEKRKMTFQGAEVTDAQLEKYHRFWREGFSETAVLEMISDDLQRGLWFNGHHKADVRRTTGEEQGMIAYTFEMTPGPVFEKGEFEFVDAERYPAKELEEDMEKVYPSRTEMLTEAIHNPDSFNEKISAFYTQRGLLRAEVTSHDVRYTEEGSVIARFVVAEGPQSHIRSLEVSNGDAIPAELTEKLELKEGSVYLPQSLPDDELTIRNYFEHKGYRKTRLNTSVKMDHDSGDVSILYELKLGEIARVDSVKISGNHQTDRDLILRRLELKEGDTLNADKLSSAQRRLNALRIFHYVRLEAIETDVPNRYDVEVDVLEREKYELTTGLRYDTEKGIGGEVQIADMNLFGDGKGLSLYTRINVDNQLFRTVYHSPTRTGLQWTTLATASYETGELLLRETDQFGLAEGQRYNLSLERQHRVWDPFVLVANYSFERLHTRPLLAPAGTPFDTFNISRVGGTLYQDTRDDPLNARRGRFLSFDLQYAPGFLLSDVSFVKSYTQFLNFQQVGRMLWASGLRLGLSSNLEPRILTERFFAGGSYTIRGFKKDQVGPKDAFGNPIGGEAVLLINQELRFPLYKWVGGAVFYDGGNVYDNFGDFRPWDLRHSVGAGIRIDSPLGLFRLDYGVNLDPQPGEPRTVIHFGIGQAF